MSSPKLVYNCGYGFMYEYLILLMHAMFCMYVCVSVAPVNVNGGAEWGSDIVALHFNCVASIWHSLCGGFF